MFGYVTFNMKYYILSQMFYKNFQVDFLQTFTRRQKHLGKFEM